MTERAGTATVVFTDLVGSTALRARLGEEQADALQGIHDGMLTARVEANGGQVLKRVGDGMVAVFPAASDALTATVQIQQAIARYNRRPDALAELSIRVGLSTGDVSWEGGDCFGTPMVEAARLEAAAAGGQILCSDFVRMMARGRGGHEFSVIGFLELKGLPEPLAACEVMWSSAPELAFPLPSELATRTGRPFVSRAGELELAEQVLTDHTRERVAVLWLLGEPGIGKTRLATEIALRAHAAGAPVLFGRCNEDLAVPYQPFLEALHFFTAQLPDDELDERLGEGAGELMRLLPELGARLPGREPPRGGSPEAEQYRLFEAVRAWLAAAGGGRGTVVVVLDDVHWATGPTLALLGHVARRADASRALLVCTARNTSPDDNEALAALVEDLERKGVPSHRLELGGLGVDDVGELVSAAAGRRLDDRLRALAGELVTETGGNPLFLDGLLANFPPDPAWQSSALPGSVTETVRRRVVRLPGDVADLLRVASVAGLDFDLRVLSRAAECRELDTLEALEAADGAGLVVEAGVDRYRFTHALVRSALRDGLSRSRRARLHLAVGEAIEALHGDDPAPHAPALAYHFFEAVPAGGGQKAYRYSVLAAEEAFRLLSFSEAADAYGRAIELLDHTTGSDPLARAHLLLARGRAQRRASDFPSAMETFREAVAEVRQRGTGELLAEVAVAFEDASFEPGYVGVEAVELLEEAGSALGVGDSALHVRVAASLSRGLEFSGRRAEGIAKSENALAMARRLGDPATTADVLHRTLFVQRTAAPTELAERAAELAELARELGDDDLYCYGAWFLMHSAARLGDLTAADRGIQEISDVGRRAGLRWEWQLLMFRATRALLAADLGLSEQLLRRSQEDPPRGIDAQSVIGVATFLLRREQGLLAGLAPILRTIVELNPKAALWGPGLAALYAELGMLDDARAELERLATDGFAALPDDGTREQCLAFLAEVAVAVGDGACAVWLLDALRFREGTLLWFWGNHTCHGPADRLLGMLASTAGRVEDAEQWFDRALAFSRQLPSPLYVAHCLYDSAVHRDRTGGGGAEVMLAEAAEICARHGLVGLQKRVRAYQYPAGHPLTE
jgi:class 3 adenylate cyclase/tetratricopeptide (TPR) repeat protein